MITVQATRVYWENAPPSEVEKAGYPFGAAGSDCRLNINRGGGGSSKSHSIMQVLVKKFLTEKKKNILIIRKTLPSLRLSIFPLFKKVLEEFGLNDRELKSERTMMNFYYEKNFLHFGGFDDPEKIKSTEWNYAWPEEATEMNLNDFKILNLYVRAPSLDGRPNQLFFSFNPVDEYHWLKTELLDNPSYDGKKEIVSTYKDNPFLPQEIIDQYNKLEQQDMNFFRIYALGEWGRLENLIFTNYDFCPTEPQKELYNEAIRGLDFGYNNPSALVKIFISNNQEEVWEKEELYASNLTNRDLIEEMKKIIPESEWDFPIYGDPAEPDRIEEIRSAGFNCIPQRRSGNSVKNGIDFMKTLRCHILETSYNLKKEIQAYSWKTDRNGRLLDEPVKFLDHLMDARRGALWTHLGADMGQAKIRYI